MAVSYLKKGEDSQKLAEQEKAAALVRQSQQGKMWRFFMKPGEQNVKLTFVDGALSTQGFLLPTRFYEHAVKVNGTWQNFPCLKKTDPGGNHTCPLCDAGDVPALISLFTVIDHRSFPGKDNKVYVNTPKLFAAKPKSMELLNTIAVKRGGLAGATFDVVRATEKDPAVGSFFDFCEKNPIDVLEKHFTRTVKDKDGKESVVTAFAPANYDAEVTFMSGEEMAKLGLGGNTVSSGFSGGGGGTAPSGSILGATTNYAENL